MNPAGAQFWAAYIHYQANRPDVPKDSEALVEFRSGRNAKYSFAALPGVFDRLLPALATHQLALSQVSYPLEGILYLRSELVHGPSGEGIAAELPICSTSTTGQQLGSAMTFSRRYAALLLGLLAPDEDTDAGDLADGNQAVTRPKPKPRHAVKPAPASSNDVHGRLVAAVGKARTLGQLDTLTERSDFVAALDGLDEIHGPLVRSAIGAKRREFIDKADAHRLSRKAAILCTKPAFWKWIGEVHGIAVTNEAEAAAWMHDRYGIESRSALDTDGTATAVFKSDAGEFDAWMNVP